MATNPVPDNEELVEVFGTKEESEAMVVSGLLDSAGIDNLVSSLEAPQDVLPGVGGIVIKVPADQAEEARRLIEEYREAPEATEDDLGPEEPV
jgi:hypothetical protein